MLTFIRRRRAAAVKRDRKKIRELQRRVQRLRAGQKAPSPKHQRAAKSRKTPSPKPATVAA